MRVVHLGRVASGAPHNALSELRGGELTFDERSVVHRAASRGVPRLQETAPSHRTAMRPLI